MLKNKQLKFHSCNQTITVQKHRCQQLLLYVILGVPQPALHTCICAVSFFLHCTRAQDKSRCLESVLKTEIFTDNSQIFHRVQIWVRPRRRENSLEAIPAFSVPFPQGHMCIRPGSLFSLPRPVSHSLQPRSTLLQLPRLTIGTGQSRWLVFGWCQMQRLAIRPKSSISCLVRLDDLFPLML